MDISFAQAYGTSRQAIFKTVKLTTASTGTSWPARSLVRSGVIIIAPIVEHLHKAHNILLALISDITIQ
jgi:hypothetical protein